MSISGSGSELLEPGRLTQALASLSPTDPGRFQAPLAQLESASIVAELHSEGGDRRQRYGFALVAITIAFAIQGISTPSKWEEMVVSALLGFVLLLALWEARAKRRLMLAAAVVVAGAILASIGTAASGSVDDAATRLPDALVVALSAPAIVVGAARKLRSGQQVTLQTVFAVLSMYMLIGIFFANVYVSMNRLGGNPFFAAGQPANVANCMYFSFSTLTTVGYGDFTARTNLGHTLSGFEGILGPLYLITVVSLIVTNIGRRRPVRGGADTPRELPSLSRSPSGGARSS